MKQPLSLLFLSFFLALSAAAQDRTVEMADGMRQSGKIYVVVACIVAIFAGIIFYLVRLDRKITRLEKDTKHIDH